jgi:hypothetical protein
MPPKILEKFGISNNETRPGINFSLFALFLMVEGWEIFK